MRYLHELRRRASEGAGPISSRVRCRSSDATSDLEVELSEAASIAGAPLVEQQLRDEDSHEEAGDSFFTYRERLGSSDHDQYLATPRDSQVKYGDTQSIWTSPFSVPSTIIANPHKNKRNWSESLNCSLCGLKLTTCFGSLDCSVINLVFHS